MVETVIEVEGLTKKYGTISVVDNLTLSIHKGEVFGLLGPNGAGKSTTILMLLGLSEPSSGTVSVCGYNSTRSPLEVKRKVGYLPDNVGFYEDLTGLENLMYTAELNSIPKQIAEKKAIELLEQIGLKDAMHKRAGKYSRGMRQRLGLADVLIKNPEIIILDEPTLGIDPEGIQELLALIHSLSKEHGITVLLSSHQLHQVQQICDRVGLFVKGKLLAVGNINELAGNLFTGEGIEIDIKTNEVTEQLCQAISELGEVNTFSKKDQQHLTVLCNTDASHKIAKLILGMNLDLFELTVKQYGLDEIYHRYFQGGDSNEMDHKPNAK